MFTRDHNCLSWALSQVLGEETIKVLPWEQLYYLDSQKEVGCAFQEVASLWGVKSRRLDDSEVEEAIHRVEKSNQKIIAVFGYFTVEKNYIAYTEYENTGFHIALCKKGVWLHKPQWGVNPNVVSLKELKKLYGDPIFFEVKKGTDAV